MMKRSAKAEMVSKIGVQLSRNLSEAGSDVRLVRFEAEKRIGNVELDAVATVQLPGPQRRQGILLIEAKRVGEPAHLAQAVTQLKEYANALESRRKEAKTGSIGLLVVAPFVSERGRALCKSQGIGYMDFAGNCRITLGAYTLDKLGRENPKKERREARTLFSPKAARILRALLHEPNRRWTISELSKQAGVSLGQAYKVIKKLEVGLYASRDKNYRVALEKPGELLDAWARGYRAMDQNKRLAYYSFQQNASALMKQISQVAKAEKLEYALALHAGASLVAPFTRFNETQFYVNEADVEAWVKGLDLRPAEAGGNVQLLIPKDEGVLYGKQVIRGFFVVSNLQLYLDLVNHPARGKEQADVLRERVLEY